MLYAFLLDPTESSYELEKLAGAILKPAQWIACRTRRCTGQMSAKLVERAEKAGVLPLYRDVEAAGRSLADMETRGVLLDSELLRKLSDETSARAPDKLRRLFKEHLRTSYARVLLKLNSASVLSVPSWHWFIGKLRNNSLSSNTPRVSISAKTSASGNSRHDRAAALRFFGTFTKLRRICPSTSARSASDPLRRLQNGARQVFRARSSIGRIEQESVEHSVMHYTA